MDHIQLELPMYRLGRSPRGINYGGRLAQRREHRATLPPHIERLLEAPGRNIKEPTRHTTGEPVRKSATHDNRRRDRDIWTNRHIQAASDLRPPLTDPTRRQHHRS